MTNLLYSIIIYPLQIVIETVYLLFFRIFGNYGLAIAGVSFAVNLLALPLYHIAETWQQKERDTQKRLKPKLDKIRAVFKGDERYMIMQTYYKQNRYHPAYAMRSSISLLIQLPFFIAAYVFLSNLTALQGQPFLWIKNLSVPDALFSFGSFTVNALPIVMTLINIIAGAVYTRGFLLKDKVQIYGMALLFLLLLYNSPSGLVLYWTLNNVFSLVKNCFYKIKKPLVILYALFAAAAIALIIYVNFFLDTTIRKRLLITVLMTGFLPMPLYLTAIRLLLRRLLFPLLDAPKTRFALMITACLLLTFLCGLAVPSSVIASSPQEFSFIDSYTSPLPFLAASFAQSAGIFLFWTFCVYFLFSKKIQTLLAFFMNFLALSALVNVFLFPGSYGPLSNTLVFSDSALLRPDTVFTAINSTAAVLCAIFILYLIRAHKVKLLTQITAVLFTGITIIAAADIISIQTRYTAFSKTKNSTSGAGAQEQSSVFNLTPSGKNVVIIMADRAINSLVPFIFKEKPELYTQFEGFTYYPNTLSFNGHTLMGVPPVYGGYEYTPEEINKRPHMKLVDKHNEALTVLPRLFADNGFDVTVTDASWANYSWTPDNRIFAKYADIKALNIQGKYKDAWLKKNNMILDNNISGGIKRNLLYYSLLRIAPPSMRFGLFDEGRWWNSEYKDNLLETFLEYYSALDFLPEITSYHNKKNTFSFITLDVTHESVLLQAPDYIPVQQVTDTGPAVFTDAETFMLFHINTSALLRLGDWFDHLRKNGAYDNTRIIIVSDHGAHAHVPAFAEFTKKKAEYGYYNPLLMVKDFNSHNMLKTETALMTNADVPYLATMGNIVAKQENPFTGKMFACENAKKNGVKIYTARLFNPEHHNKNTFILDESETVLVTDTIFEEKNWSVLP